MKLVHDRKHHEPFLETVEEGEWSSPGTVEHKLEFTEVYNLFLRHFEDKISGKCIQDRESRSATYS